VGKDQPGTAQRRRHGNDVADRKGRAACIALVARQVQAPALLIEMGDEQMFFSVVTLGETSCEEALRCAAVSNLQGWFGTLKLHRALVAHGLSGATGTVSETDGQNG
jgi:hypothetical protein